MGRISIKAFLETKTGKSFQEIAEKFSDIETVEDASQLIKTLTDGKFSPNELTLQRTFEGIEGEFKFLQIEKKRRGRKSKDPNKVTNSENQTPQVDSNLKTMRVHANCKCGNSFSWKTNQDPKNIFLGLKAIRCPKCSEFGKMETQVQTLNGTVKIAVLEKNGISIETMIGSDYN